MDSVKTNLISTPYVDKYGTKRYYLPDGITLHREDGPAVESDDGHKQWWLNGKLHRVDGPAVEYTNGRKKWHLNGVPYSFEEWNRLRKMLWML